MDRFAMAWQMQGDLPREKANPRSVRRAGFKGYVALHDEDDPDQEQDDFEDIWHRAQPRSTPAEHKHYEEHGDYPDSYHERQDQNYADISQKQRLENVPDHHDEHLGHFMMEHGSRADWERGGGKLTKVDLGQGVHATQSHVAQFHVDRYLKAPKDSAWYLQQGGTDHEYLGNHHPMFVTHHGQLHAVEGHHRIAAAIQRGDTHIRGWHFDLDKHPIQSESDIIHHPDGTREWGPTGHNCPECEEHVANSPAHSLAS